MNYRANERVKGTRGSALIVFSLVLALVSCAASGYLFFRWNQLSQENIRFESVRTQLKDEINSLETDLQAALKEQQTLKVLADEKESENEKVASELAETKKGYDQLQAEVQKLKKEKDSLKKIAVQLKSQTQQTADAVQTAASTAHAEPMPAEEAMKVKTINRTFNFVVFDLVPGVPVRAGDDAVIQREGRWISDLKIKQVYAQFASAEIRKEDDNQLIQIGDSVFRA